MAGPVRGAPRRDARAAAALQPGGAAVRVSGLRTPDHGARRTFPVLSWLVLRGKCSQCGTPISARYPVVELLGGMLAAAAIWRFGPTWHGPRRVRVPVDAARADVHRLRHAAPARRPHAAAAVGRADRQPLRAVRAAARRGDRRHRGLPRAVEHLLAVQADSRQGRHGLRRLQAARRARRLARLEDASADHPRLVGRGRGDRHHARRIQGARPQRSACLRTVPRDRRHDRACSSANRSSRCTSRTRVERSPRSPCSSSA